MTHKDISIVLATYNGSRYLKDQLQSLVVQTLRPAEIIVSDDISNDDTPEILDEFERASGLPVRIIKRQTRLGFRENFLQTAREARGDFIAFCDQDDVWRADKLERCAQFFSDNAVSMIVHSSRTIDHTSKHTGYFRQGIRNSCKKPPLSYDLWHGFWGFSIVLRRDLLDVVPIETRFKDYIAPDHLIAHDRWVTFLGQMLGTTVELSDHLVDYRQHDTNLFGQAKYHKLWNPSQLENRTNLYIEIAQQMLAIVTAIDPSVADKFPLFDRARCIEFISLSIDRLKKRREVYRPQSRARAFMRTSAGLWDGTYRSVNSEKVRWKSVIRDLQFIALRSGE